MYSPFQYPEVERTNFSDPVTKIDDPYRYLEDPESEKTKQFVENQNKLTDAFLDTTSFKSKLYESLEKVANFPKYSAPTKHGDYYYHYYNSGLQNHYALFRSKKPYENPELFFDPNTLSTDGTISAGSKCFSDSGKLFSYIEHTGGSDWGVIKIIDVESKTYLNDQLDWIKFSSLCFTKDDTGLFYSRYPKVETKDKGTETQSNINHALYYHKIGTSQDDDILICKPDDNTNTIGAGMTDDCKYLLISISDGCKSEHKLYYIDLEKDGFKVVKLINNFEATYNIIHNDNTTNDFYIITNLLAPMNKIIKLNLDTLDIIEYIPERSYLLSSACISNNKQHFICNYNKDVHDILELYSLNENKFVGEVDLPSFGSVGFSSKPEDKEFYYTFSSFIHPGDIYLFSFDTLSSTHIKSPEVPGYDVNNYETKQIFYNSKDGTKIPMFITSKKGRKNNGLLLYGYGGFNISIDPSFSPTRTVLMDILNLDFAVANIRGGGEYGHAWHEAGMLDKKQNVFDDFQSAAEYLINNNFVDNDKLFIQGGSNGGLLVGACINQRPELYRGAILQVGVLDMLRFHLFTIGHAWQSEYGSPDDETTRKHLLTYSPLHNINGSKTYPSLLCCTSDKDDRVSPLHSYKFMAELQYQVGKNSQQKNPLLLMVDTKAGHGGGKPLKKALEEISKIYTFIANTLGLEL